MTNKTHRPVLAITSGEPAGIGPDLCLQLSAEHLPYPCVILADKNLLAERAAMLGIPYQLPDFSASQPQKLSVCHIPLKAPTQAGCLNADNAAYVIELLDTAYQGIQNQQFASMVTAPIHKGIINDARLPHLSHFSGHTEYLAQISHTKQVVMMLIGGGLRVALLTTHLPLKDISQAIQPDLLDSVLDIVHHDLQQQFHIAQPRILVCGLNPHAGEGGHLGDEEIHLITPAIKRQQAQGRQVSGPYPADTVFQPFILEQGDVVLAMYHDQGLPTLKYASFGQGVNVTLGLPFIRTSVDHGTALNLAGSGKAHSGSLQAAIQVAVEMIGQNRFK